MGLLPVAAGRLLPEFWSPKFEAYNRRMAKLCLVYGMRLLPSEDIEEVNDATIKMKHERTARVSLHILEGSKEDIEKQLRLSVEAFFDMYPEI